MILVPYRLNGRALLARIVYRWRGRTLLVLLALLVAGGIGSGRVPPVWRGTAALVVEAAPDAVITVDGRRWPHAIYAGRHTVLAALPDGRSAVAAIELVAAQPLTVTLPAGLPAPRVRQIPPPAPGTAIQAIGWADGAWRIRSGPRPATGATTAAAARSEGASAPVQTVALAADGMAPLPTLDAYGGLADQIAVAGRRREAVYRADAGQGRSTGAIEIRGWAEQVTSVALEHAVTLVRWSPAADALLVGEQIGADAEQLRLLRSSGTDEVVVAVRGRVRDVVWSSDGSGLLVASSYGGRLTLTLARVAPSVAARVVAEIPVGDAAGAAVSSAEASGVEASLPPLHWDGDALEWIAPDAGGVSYLWRASLGSLLPERQQPLAAVALTRTADGGLRVVAADGPALVIGRPGEHGLIVETAIAGVRPGANLAGQWSPRGDQLVLQAGADAWLVEIKADSGR